jgi:hypothetical protein
MAANRNIIGRPVNKSSQELDEMQSAAKGEKSIIAMWTKCTLGISAGIHKNGTTPEPR